MIVSAAFGNAHQAEPRRELALVHHALADEVGVLGVVHDQRIEIARVRSSRGASPARWRRSWCASVKATAPAALSRPISASSWPLRPLVSAAIGCTLHDRGVARAAHDEVDRRRIVDRRRGVGPADDRGDAAGRGRLARGRERLAMFGAGFADEGPHVDEAGRDDLAAAVDDLGALRHAGGADAGLARRG